MVLSLDVIQIPNHFEVTVVAHYSAGKQKVVNLWYSFVPFCLRNLKCIGEQVTLPKDGLTYLSFYISLSSSSTSQGHECLLY